MTKKEAQHFRKLTHFPMAENSMFKKFIVSKFNAFRTEVEKALVDTSDSVCLAVDATVRFISNVFWALKTIGAVTLLMFLLLTFILAGCAHHGYYAHLWCKSSTKNVSFGLYTQDDGKLMVKVYDADGGCSYVKDQNVVIQSENQTVK